MSHGHGHVHHALDARRAGTRRRLWVALAINGGLVIAQGVGGALTDSLALLADAGHLLSDTGAIALGLVAATLASRPGSGRRTFGYQRGEVLAALANGIALVVIAVVVAWAAIGRFGDPPEVEAGGVLALGLVGLAGNVVAAAVLARGERSDLNLEGVLRHSIADALGSLGVIVAGAVLLAGGPGEVDAAVGLAIALLILLSSWRLIREPFDVLMESAPAGFDMEELGQSLLAVEGVREVHELHVWTLTAGFGAIAAHVVVAPGTDRDLARRRLEVVLRERFGIHHTTLQMEEEVEQGLLRLESGPGVRDT